MNNDVKSITIVGGGTAGLISALILQYKFSQNISFKVVCSSKIGIIGVGEGSTEHWEDFLKFVRIEPYEVIRKCGATLKSGIYFENWSDKDYFHNVSIPYDTTWGQERINYVKLISEQKNPLELFQKYFLLNKVNSNHLNNQTTPTRQFHFNTQLLNDFLVKTCKERGIEIIDDDIEDVLLNDKGEIDKLKGIKSDYKSDFYIDCTGFKRLLISKLGAKWQSYSKYLKLKSAIVFPTEDTENYNMYTTAKALKYGWRFNIPVWGRHGNGYIFDSDYINADEAKEEVEKDLNKNVDVTKVINFDPGALDKVWIKNCYAIGLAANFVEPLEATSIGTSIQQSYILMHNLVNYNQNTINYCNKQVNSIMDNIRDFICLHYITKKNDSQFWLDLKNISLPDNLQKNLELWKNRLPIEDDFQYCSKYKLFTDHNYILVLYGLGLLNVENIKKQYDKLPGFVKNYIYGELSKEQNLEIDEKYMTHKSFINKIRS